MNWGLAIQADEQGEPVFVEFDPAIKKFKEVNARRWREILEEGDIDPDETPQAIVPVEIKNEIEPWMFSSA